MPKTRVNCPNCRQPVVAEINQLFDVGVDPKAKQLILSGAYNLIQCQACGYQGNLATPLVYHDPEKELLLTYFPPELGMPVTDQERVIGPLVTQAMNNLPQEKRKAYLLRPQTMLTMQTLVERILEGDGITKEMIQEQQKRLQLLQRMVEAPDDVLAEMAKTEDSLIDENFFQLISRLAQAALLSGDQDSAKRLNELQKKLIPITTFGREIQAQSKEVEAAMASLQALGDQMTREKLLNLFVEAPTELRLNVLVSMTRQALDYSFFQMMTEQIDSAQGEKRQKLLSLREHILELSRQIDQEMEKRAAQAKKVVEELTKAKDIRAATQENLGAVDDFFLRALNELMEGAHKASDLDKLAKLNQIAAVLQEASAPPEEYGLIEELLNTEDSAAMKAKLEANKEKLTGGFLDVLADMIAQAGSADASTSGSTEEDQALKTRLEELYSLALRMSMQANL